MANRVNKKRDDLIPSFLDTICGFRDINEHDKLRERYNKLVEEKYQLRTLLDKAFTQKQLMHKIDEKSLCGRMFYSIGLVC